MAKESVNKKAITFRYIVIRNLIIGYIAIFVLLFVVLSYAQYDAQRSVLQVAEAAADIYINELNRQIENVESRSLSWYAQDRMGASLENAGGGTKPHLVAFNMTLLFKEEIARDENIRAAFVFFNDLQTARYAQASGFDDRRIRELKALVKNEIDPKERTNCWKILHYDDEVYLVHFFGKNGVLTGEVLDFIRITSKLTNGMDHGVSTVYTDGEQMLTNSGSTEAFENFIHSPEEKQGDRWTRLQGQELCIQREILPGQLYFYLITQASSSLNKQVSVIGTLLLLLITLVSAFYSYHLFRRQMIVPLGQMTATLERIGSGDQQVRMQEQLGLAEYDEFGRHFNEMMDQIQDLKIASYEEKLNREKVLLQLLRFQIEPHFYLNSLTTIYALSQQKKYDIMENNLLTISDYIRYSFKNDFSPVKLADELKFAEDTYKLRKDSRNFPIFLTIHASRELMEEMVLPFSVQTFVENSMKYAVNEEGLYVDIQVSRYETEEGAFLDVTVSDNGQGYPEEWLTIGNGSIDYPEEDKHVGLINLKKRLQLEYADRATLFLRNSHGAVSEIIYTLEN